MSNEIVSVLDGNETLSVDTRQDVFGMHYKPRGYDLTTGFRPQVEVDLIGGNHKMNHFLNPNQGHKHVHHYNPTRASIQPILEKMKEPSVLLLRGCELLLQQDPFFFENFKTLTSLEISGINFLTSVPDAISEMTQLQSLNLSHLPIQQFPSDQFFSKLTSLRSIVLRGCCHLHSLPPFPNMPKLQCLDLSYLLIETLPLQSLPSIDKLELRWLILTGCSRLRSLEGIHFFDKLQVLDLSHCTTLQEIDGGDYIHQRSLQMLDLSYTAFPKVILLDCPNLTHLFARDTKSIESDLTSLSRLTMVDLSGVADLNHVFWFESNCNLVVLDLSRTEIESIDLLSNQIHLRHLLLRGCTKLVDLSEISNLTNLEVLDISGCEILADLSEDLNSLRNIKELDISGCTGLKKLREGLFDKMACLEKLDLSKTNVSHLPSFANLTNLRSLNLSHTSVDNLPDLSNLVNLKELLLENCQKLKIVPDIQALRNLDQSDFGLEGHDGIDLIGVQSSGLENLQEKRLGWDGSILPTYTSIRNSNPNEFYLVSTFLNGESGFDRFKYEFKKLEILISNIEKKIKSTSIGSPTTANKLSESFNKKIGAIHRDLKYILKYIDLLECSFNSGSSEELLNELMNVAIGFSNDDFSLDSLDLSELIRVVVKLKLLVPPPKHVGGEDDGENKKKKKKKMILCTSKKEKGETISSIGSHGQDLSSSYDSLTDVQQRCLLYFAAFSLPEGKTHLNINVNMLIQLWYGEGFIDLVPHDNSITQYQPTSNQNLNHIDVNPNSKLSMSTSTSLVRKDTSRDVSTTNGVEISASVKEMGIKILNVLLEKKFIMRLFGRFYTMKADQYYFVKTKAKESLFFDLDDKNGKLTSHFKGSQRVCLLKSQAHCQSSCHLWLSYANSSKKQESFNNVRTLLQVSESIIDLNLEWFPKMKNLIVLHLGSMNYGDEEHFNVIDLKFLQELENMKQLRLLSLEGFSAIVKLPKSVCMINNLRMLNLKYCCNLEEIPASIMYLENLTHLDLTHCHLLSMLPKGLNMITKLEVLKGFVITYEADGRQHTKACTLKELLMLEKLKKLNLVVNRDNFPYNKDLHVLKEMKSLCNLKITWKKDYDKGQEPEDSIGHGVLRQSKWKQLKCWEQPTHQSDTEELLRSNRLHDLKKLVICCFPSETTPNWLHPRELQTLEKFHVIGGNLKTLPGGTDQNTWSVKALRLRHLSNLDMDWLTLKGIFPYLTYCERHKCPHIRNFPKRHTFNLTFPRSWDIWYKK